ncbi:MAG: hypothetical protein RLP44_18855 [Aggregatilineales bacterium]
MWRGIVSILALLLMCGASAIIIPILILPNTDLHLFVPVLKPLHQALACEAGETMEYDYQSFDGVNETHFRCVDGTGRERDVDSVLRRPAHYAFGVFFLGGLLMLLPFYVAVKQGMMGETGPAMQEALQQSYEQMRQLSSEMTQSTPATLTASGQQQFDALNKLRQQGFITQEAYESAKKQIFDNFSET